MMTTIFSLDRCWHYLFLSVIFLLFNPVRLLAQSDIRDGSITLTEVWRLGEEEGQDVLFGNINDVQIDSQGQLYVHDWDHEGIYKISGTGSLLHQIGSKGSGPGEFEHLSGIYVGQGDTVYAMDGSLERIYKYASPDHEFFDMRRIQRVEGSLSDAWTMVGANPMGFLVVYMPVYTTWLPETMTSKNNFDVYLVNQDGVRSEKIIFQMPAIERLLYEDNRGYTHMPFSPDPVVSIGKDGRIYAGNGEESTIRILSFDGEIERILSWEIEPIPVTSEDIEKTIDNSGELRLKAIKAAELPENKPYYQHFTVDDQNQVWVQLSTPYGATETEWLIIDGDSNIANRFMFPSNVRLFSVKNGKAYGVEDDIILVAYSIE